MLESDIRIMETEARELAEDLLQKMDVGDYMVMYNWYAVKNGNSDARIHYMTDFDLVMQEYTAFGIAQLVTPHFDINDGFFWFEYREGKRVLISGDIAHLESKPFLKGIAQKMVEQFEDTELYADCFDSVDIQPLIDRIDELKCAKTQNKQKAKEDSIKAVESAIRFMQKQRESATPYGKAKYDIAIALMRKAIS